MRCAPRLRPMLALPVWIYSIRGPRQSGTPNARAERLSPQAPLPVRAVWTEGRAALPRPAGLRSRCPTAWRTSAAWWAGPEDAEAAESVAARVPGILEVADELELRAPAAREDAD
jgi:hypothetical protein